MEIQFDEKRKSELKQNALVYMPRDLSSVQSQKQILKMVADVLSPVKACIQQTDAQLWPKVENGELPLNQAIAQCAFQSDQAIGSTLWEDVRYERFSEQMLLRAWIALEYYVFVLKDAYSVNVRKAQADITTVLLKEKKSTQPAGNAIDSNCDKTVLNPKKDVVDPDKIKTVISREKGALQQEKRNIQETTPVNPVLPVNPVTPVKPVQKSKLRLVIAVSVILVGAFLATSLLFNKPWQVKNAINRIGTVTLGSEEAILDAEELVAQLTEEELGNVDNYNTLLEAREEYDRLKTQEAIDQIGKVTVESESAIAHAEKLYDALPRLTRGKVENYVALASARKELTRLQTAVADAEAAIVAIGTVTLESGDAIRAAREAYDALKADNLESYVADQSSVLVEAEKTYAQYASEDLYNTGVVLYEKGSYEEAITKFGILISEYPDAAVTASARDVKASSQIGLARNVSQKNDQYTAITILNSIEEPYKETEEYREVLTSIQTKLKNTRPTTGLSIGDTAGWGQCYFEITAAETDVCVKIKELWDPDKYKMVYIRAGDTTKIYIEDGTYTVSWATGDYWFGEDHLFGDNTKYMHINGTMDFSTTYEGNWVHYYYSQIDLGDSGLSALVIQEDEF